MEPASTTLGPYAREVLERLLSRLTEVSIDSGDATSGSLTTIVDTTKNWETDKWKDAIVEVEVDDVHYYRTISSNTADTLTIATLPAGHPVAAGAHYNIRMALRLADIDKWGGTALTGRDISAKGLGFSGAVYENENLATTDDPRRFETTSRKLRDLIIQVSGNDQLFGNETNQRYKVAVGEAIGFTQVDLSLLYFKNAAAGQNGTVNILGVEE